MHYLFVHGSWHGAWCWERLTPFLQKEGHTTECLDFPGYGKEALGVVTYHDYYTSLERAIVKHEQPLVLVSHSMSGIVAGPLADRLRDRVCYTFFIAAFLPQKGESLLEVALRYSRSALPSILHVDTLRQWHLLDPKGAARVLYHDCSPEVQQWALSRLRPQPYSPLEEPLDWEDHFETRDRRCYFICDRDRAVDPKAQRDMVRNHPCRIEHLHSGHFPFLSDPEEFAKKLAV